VPDTIESMASAYLAVVRAQQPEGPYFLGGFCGGAVVAWEMACQLRDRGLEVSKLVIVEPPDIETGRMARAIHAVMGTLAKRFRLSDRARVRMMTRALRLAKLRYRPVTTAALRSLPRAITRSLRLEALPEERRAAIAAHYSRAVGAYLPRPFDAPVLCLFAEEEDNEQALATWRGHACDLTARDVPGDHNSCIVTHARALAHALSTV
jgi:thioesterase domain-containing protein